MLNSKEVGVGMEDEKKEGDISVEDLKVVILNSLPLPATYSEKAKQLSDTYGAEKYSKALKELIKDGLIKVTEDLKLVITEKGKQYLNCIGKSNIEQFITEDGIRGLFGEVIETPTQEEFIERLLSYFKDMEAMIVEKYGDVFNIWATLPIEELNIVRVGDDESYEFTIFKKKFRIDGSKIMNPANFISTFFKVYGVVLPNIPKKVWYYILTKWKTTIAKFTKERFTDEDVIIDTILNYINSSLVAKDIKLSFNEGVVYVDHDKVYVPNTIIRRILERERFRISSRRLAEILKDYKYPNERKKISGQHVYFWVFKLDKLSIDLSKTVESEEVQKKLGDAVENSD